MKSESKHKRDTCLRWVPGLARRAHRNAAHANLLRLGRKDTSTSQKGCVYFFFSLLKTFNKYYSIRPIYEFRNFVDMCVISIGGIADRRHHVQLSVSVMGCGPHYTSAVRGADSDFFLSVEYIRGSLFLVSASRLLLPGNLVVLVGQWGLDL